MRTYPTFRAQKILALQERGRKVEQITPYQFRIDGKIDLYPVNGLYHNLVTGKRGYIPFGIL